MLLTTSHEVGIDKETSSLCLNNLSKAGQLVTELEFYGYVCFGNLTLCAG